MELRKRSFAARKGDFCIMALGDIQWTGREEDVAIDLLKRRIAYGIENNAQFIGMGDYIDFASPSNRASLAGSKIYDNARNIIEDAALSLTDQVFEEILKPTKGRWLGLHEGHHFYQLQDGLTTDWYLARKLGTECLGWVSMTKIDVTKRRPLVVWGSHGCGSGQTVGSMANKIDKQAQVFDADVFLMGHWTRLGSNPVQKLSVDWSGRKPKLEHRTVHLVGTGGFSRAYIEGAKDGLMPRGGYVEQRLMRPTVLGCPLIRFSEDGEVSVEL